MGQCPWVRCRVVHGHEGKSKSTKMGIGKNGNLNIAENKKKVKRGVISSLFTVDASLHFVTAIGDLRIALLQLWHS